MPRKKQHPACGDLYTPITPELVGLIDQMYRELGTWRDVSAVTGTRLKVIRNIRFNKRKVISMRLLDRMITTTSIGRLNDYVWFTADDLVALGIWKDINRPDFPNDERFDPQSPIRKEMKRAKTNKRARLRKSKGRPSRWGQGRK